MNAATKQIDTLTDVRAKLMRSAIDAFDMANLGRESAQDLRSILVAIVGLSDKDSVIYGLAKVGQGLADDRIDLLGCECDAKQKTLAAVRGVA